MSAALVTLLYYSQMVMYCFIVSSSADIGSDGSGSLLSLLTAIVIRCCYVAYFEQLRANGALLVLLLSIC